MKKLEQIEERLEREKKKVQQLQAQKRQLLNRKKKEERKLDTRRKILVGAVLLKLASSEPKLDEYIKDALDKNLETEADRALFGFAPICDTLSPEV